MDNKSLSHTRWKCQYHIVFIPKYRKKILYGKVREDVREILSTLCKYKNVDIIAGAVCADHVHLSVAIPPKLSISNFMGYLKDAVAVCSLRLLLRFMHRQVPQVVGLTSAYFNFHFFDTALFSRYDANATIEILLWVEIFGVFKGVA